MGVGAGVNGQNVKGHAMRMGQVFKYAKDSVIIQLLLLGERTVLQHQLWKKDRNVTLKFVMEAASSQDI